MSRSSAGVLVFGPRAELPSPVFSPLTSLMGLLKTICDWGSWERSDSRVRKVVVEAAGNFGRFPLANMSSSETAVLGTPPLAPPPQARKGLLPADWVWNSSQAKV